MDASSLLNTLQKSLAAIGSLPLGAHVIPILMLICGLVFWLVGGRFLRQLFVLIGLVAGAAIGAIFAPKLLPDHVGSIPGSYVGIAIGGVLGLIASSMAFRFSMTVCTALALAAAGALGTGVYLSRDPAALPLDQVETARETLTPSAEHYGETLKSAADEYQKTHAPGDSTTPGTTPPTDVSAATASAGAMAVDATRQFADEVWTEARGVWDSAPERSRLLLIAGAAVGALIGAGAGMAMPKRSASVVTAIAGAGLTLLSAGWLARTADLPGGHLLSDRGPLGLLIVWAGMALFGAMVQLRSGGGTKKAPEEKKKD